MNPVETRCPLCGKVVLRCHSAAMVETLLDVEQGSGGNYFFSIDGNDSVRTHTKLARGYRAHETSCPERSRNANTKG